MANEYRWVRNFAFGTLSQAVSISDTTVNSAELAELPSVSGGLTYIPIVLLNQATRAFEIVWVTAHVEGATSATVIRGRESTSAVSWPQQTQWICAPTAWDALQRLSSTTLPSDGHLGMRGTLNDFGEVYEKTYQQGWMGHFRMSGADMGRTLEGGLADPPNGYVPMHKSWTATATTNATGWADLTLPNGGFPTRLVSAQVSRVINAAAGSFYVPAVDKAASTKTSLRVWATTSSGILASAAIELSCDATGY